MLFNSIFNVFVLLINYLIISSTSVIAKLKTKVASGKFLNQYGIIQTHDSATGEFEDSRDHIVTRWAQTQRGSIVDQLDCGARSLDYRPYLSNNGTLYAHHGPIVVYKKMDDTIQEILRWTEENPTELIIISLSHCVDERFNNNYYADSCHTQMQQLLNQYNIHLITNNDCSPLDTMTMESALSKGNILAIIGCSTGYWDPSLTCTSKDYVCYDSWPTNTSSIPWSKLEDSLLYWSSFVPVSNGIFWGYGANWQSSAESDIFGTLHNSSLLLDEERSGINAWTTKTIQQGRLQYINMLGIDNVCDGGEELFKALQQHNIGVEAL
eukprot:gene5315-7379_t